MANTNNKITLSLRIKDTRKQIKDDLDQVIKGMSPPKITLSLDINSTRAEIRNQLQNMLKGVRIGDGQSLHLDWISDSVEKEAKEVKKSTGNIDRDIKRLRENISKRSINLPRQLTTTRSDKLADSRYKTEYLKQADTVKKMLTDSGFFSGNGMGFEDLEIVDLENITEAIRLMDALYKRAQAVTDEEKERSNLIAKIQKLYQSPIITGASIFADGLADSRAKTQYLSLSSGFLEQITEYGIDGTNEQTNTTATVSQLREILRLAEQINVAYRTAKQQTAEIKLPDKLALSWKKLEDSARQYLEQVKVTASRSPQELAKLENLVSRISTRTGDQTKLRTELLDLKSEFKALGLEGENAWQKLKKVFGSQMSSAFASAGVMLLRRSLSEVLQNVKTLDYEMTQLKIVTNETADAYDRLLDKALGTSKEIASSTASLLNAATVYARLGYTMDDSMDLAKYTTMYSKLGAVDIADAESNITAIIKGFDIDVDDLSETLDKLVYVGNNFPISASELGVGMQNAASSLSSAGNSIDEAIAVLTAANQVAQDAAKSSTAVRTLAARIRASDLDKATLNELGEDTEDILATPDRQAKIKALSNVDGMGGVDILQANGKDFKSTYQIFDELAARWNKISDVNQAAIIKIVAGVRQANIVTSMLENWTTAQDALTASQESGGTMVDKYTEYLDSISGKIGEFTASFEEMSSNLLNSELVDFVIELGTAFINLLGNDSLGGAPVKITALVAALASLKNVGRVKEALCYIKMPTSA